MNKKRRKIGDILLDLENIITELSSEGLQWGDILYLIYGYLMIHRPDTREEYVSGGHPEFYYGPGRKK